MQPEDIDKLFRDRLEGHAPTPPAYLWNQLEAELQPAKKRPVLWMWAAAASVALLLVSSLLWLYTGPGRISGSTPVATSGPAAQPVAPATPLEKKSSNPAEVQATPPQELASNAPKATAPEEAPAAARRQPADAHEQEPQLAAATPATRRAAPSAKRLATAPASEAVATTKPKAQPERKPAPVDALTEAQPQVAVAALRSATPPAPTGPIVVEVRRSEEPAVASVAAPEPAETNSRVRLGNLLLRQARNAVRGEKVTLGQSVLPETVTVQARVAGHTLTKVIQL